MREFNRETQSFLPLADRRVFSTSDLLTGIENGPAPTVADIKLYDIVPTVMRALRRLEERFPDSFVTVFGAPSQLRQLAAADIGPRLIAVTTIPPDEIEDSGAWKVYYAGIALDAGCDGVLVDFDCTVLAEQYPDCHFLRDD